MSHAPDLVDDPAPARGGLRPLLVSNDFLPQLGGIQEYAGQLAQRVSGAAAFAPAHPEADGFDGSAPFRVHRAEGRYLWPTPGTHRRLRTAVAATDANVLLFLAPFPLAPLGRRFNLPWAVCTHGAELVLPARLPGVRMLYRGWLRRANCLFAVSRHTGSWLRRLVGDDGPPIRLLPPGVPLDVFRPDVNGEPVRRRHRLGTDPVVLCTGRLVARKGQDMLVRALPEIRRRVPGTRLLIVGDGPRRPALERTARRLPAGTVTFAGKVDTSELPAYYAAADVFAHPNRARWLGLEEEGFGVVFLEAQASGLPVVAGRSGGSPESLLDGHSGVLVDGHDIREITSAIVGLLTDARRRRRMGEAGRRHVAHRFDWPLIAGRLEADLQRMAAGTPVQSDL